MDNKSFYTLDPVIVSTLIQAKTPEVALEMYQDLLASVATVVNDTIKEYLVENGFTQEEVDAIENVSDFENVNAKYHPYLKNIILLNRIDNNVYQFLKVYYDFLLQKLTPEEQNDLAEYVKANEELLKTKKAQVADSLNGMREILEQSGVENFKELEERAKQEETNPVKVELGGINSQNTVVTAPVTEPAPVTPVEVVPAVVTEPVVTEVASPVPATETVIAPMPTVNPEIVTTPEPVVPVTTPVAEQVVESAPEQVNATASAPVADANPFDWTSLIMDQLNATQTPSAEGANATNIATPEIVNNEAPVTPVVAPVVEQAVEVVAAPVVAESVATPAPVVETAPIAQPTVSAAAVMNDLGVLDAQPIAPGMPA